MHQRARQHPSRGVFPTTSPRRRPQRRRTSKRRLGDYDTDRVTIYGQIANWAHHARKCWPYHTEDDQNGRIVQKAWRTISKWNDKLSAIPPFDKHEKPDTIITRDYFFPAVRRKQSNPIHRMQTRSGGPGEAAVSPVPHNLDTCDRRARSPWRNPL